jgi:hypothetical protein
VTSAPRRTVTVRPLSLSVSWIDPGADEVGVVVDTEDVVGVVAPRVGLDVVDPTVGVVDAPTNESVAGVELPVLAGADTEEPVPRADLTEGDVPHDVVATTTAARPRVTRTSARSGPTTRALFTALDAHARVRRSDGIRFPLIGRPDRQAGSVTPGASPRR